MYSAAAYTIQESKSRRKETSVAVGASEVNYRIWPRKETKSVKIVQIIVMVILYREGAIMYKRSHRWEQRSATRKYQRYKIILSSKFKCHITSTSNRTIHHFISYKKVKVKVSPIYDPYVGEVLVFKRHLSWAIGFVR